MNLLARRRAVAGAMVAALVAALAGLPGHVALANGSPQGGAPWPQFKQNGARTAVSSVAGPFTLKLKWRANVSGPAIRGPIIGADGVAYVGTDKNTLIAIRSDGTQKWLVSLPGTGTPTHPAINSKDIIVVGLENGQVVGYGQDGNKQWTFDTASAPYSSGANAFRGDPVLPNNYSAMLIGDEEGLVFELDEGGGFTGIRRATSAIHSGPLVTSDGTIVWTSSGAVYAGLTQGGDKWRTGVDGDVHSTPAAGTDSTIYVGTDNGSVYAIASSNGSTKWKVSPASGKAVKSSPAVGADGTVYVGADDGRFYALNPNDGSTKWSFATGGAINGAPAIASNGLIYFGSMDGSVYVLNQAGTMVSSYKTDGPIDGSSPAIAADGTVYIGSRDNNLYAFVEGGATPTATSAAAATPVAIATPVPPAATPVPALPTDRAAPLAGAQYFPETGHNVRGAFLAFFNAQGGLEQHGYPRTEELVEGGKTVQYFQRSRFEYFPQFAGTPYEVQLGLIGDEVTASRRPFPTAAPVPSTDTLRFYPEVNHTLSDPFLTYFDAHGGLDRYGYPTSEQLQEQNNDGTGRTYTVQYFQRARMEHHPELAGTPSEVQLGLLGDQILRDRGWLKG